MVWLSHEKNIVCASWDRNREYLDLSFKRSNCWFHWLKESFLTLFSQPRKMNVAQPVFGTVFCICRRNGNKSFNVYKRYNNFFIIVVDQFMNNRCVNKAILLWKINKMHICYIHIYLYLIIIDCLISTVSSWIILNHSRVLYDKTKVMAKHIFNQLWLEIVTKENSKIAKVSLLFSHQLSQIYGSHYFAKGAK